MNKQELVNALAERTGFKKKDVDLLLNSLLEEMTERLKEGEKVQFVGFGTFETRKRAGRVGRNPQTGEAITIEEATVPVFKPGNRLKEAVR